MCVSHLANKGTKAAMHRYVWITYCLIVANVFPQINNKFQGGWKLILWSINTVKRRQQKLVGSFLLFSINIESTLNSEWCLVWEKYAQIPVTMSSIYLLGNLKHPFNRILRVNCVLCTVSENQCSVYAYHSMSHLWLNLFNLLIRHRAQR